MFRIQPIFLMYFVSFLFITNFEIRALIVDVCVGLSSSVVQYVYLYIFCLEMFHNI